MTQAANLAALGTNAGTTGILPIAGGGTAGTGGAIGFKNRIINGNVTIDQRGATVTIPAYTNTYGPDRWFGYGQPNASKFSLAKGNASGAALAAGFTNCLTATSLSAYSISSSDIQFMGQRIEGYNIADLQWGTANAKTVTLSFWAYSSISGTWGGAIVDSVNAYNYPFSYTISSANTWEYKTVTIVGPTSGTWSSTNGIGMGVLFSIGTGSSFVATAGAWTSSANIFGATGQNSLLGTNGDVLSITGCQLEVGTAATNFDVRSYGTELMLCQRYYWKWSQTAPDANTGNWLAFGWGSNWGTNTATMIRFPVPLRSAASVTLSAANTFGRHAPGIVAEVASTANSYYADTNSMNLLITSATSLSNGVGGQVNVAGSQTAFVAVSAEL